MGKLETTSKERRKRERIQRYVLSAVAVSGTLVLAAAAPNIAGMFARKIANLPQLRVRTKSAATRLAHKGLVRFVQRRGVTVLEITEHGRNTLALAQAKTLLAQNKKWDGRYRVVAFDIPQHLKKQRDMLRQTIRTLGFLHLQHSIWIFPHDCEEIVTLLKSELKLGKNVLYMIVDQIENDAWIRRHFKLPR